METHQQKNLHPPISETKLRMEIKALTTGDAYKIHELIHILGRCCDITPRGRQSYSISIHLIIHVINQQTYMSF